MLGCESSPTGAGSSARLGARPAAPSGTISPGQFSLGLGSGRDGILLVPSSYSPAQPMPLVLSLHGAGGSASGPISLLSPYAESMGFLQLAVDSRGQTWDALTDGYGPDVAFIDRALRQTLGRCAVDSARIVIEGFSDGASYALGLGLANGDLFTRVVAFSPGFIPRSDTPRQGRPDIFISHGTGDPVLPIDATSRRIVPALRADLYSVTYTEFDGGHEVTPQVATAAVAWLLR